MQTEMTLNLDGGFGQCGDDIGIVTSMFPAGEMYVRVDVPQGTQSCRINTRMNDSADFMRLTMAVDALRRNGIEDIELFMPYFPYSRQDRACRVGEAFSLRVICDMLWDMQFSRIVTYDVHSNVASVLLDGVLVNYNNHREVIDFLDYLSLSSEVTLIAPDEGAIKKTMSLRRNHPDRFHPTVVSCRKTRTVNSVEVEDIDTDLRGRTCLVVDDICDGGATFLAVAAKLEKAGAEQLYLFVSHGVFSRGQDALIRHYRMIGTSNSIRNGGGEGVKVFKLNY